MGENTENTMRLSSESGDATRLESDLEAESSVGRSNPYVELRARSRTLSEEIAGELASGVEGEGAFSRYCRVAGVFERYSPANVLLILGQNPQARRVAGVRTWNRLGRKVRKGERALKIWAPIRSVSRKDAPPEDSREEGAPTPDPAEDRVRFRLVNVFDITQTEGADLEFQWDHLPEDPRERAWWLLDGVAGGGPSEVLRGEMDPVEALRAQVADLAERSLKGRLPEEVSVRPLAMGVAHGVLHRYGIEVPPPSFDSAAWFPEGEARQDRVQFLLSAVNGEIRRQVEQYDAIVEAALDPRRAAGPAPDPEPSREERRPEEEVVPDPLDSMSLDF